MMLPNRRSFVAASAVAGATLASARGSFAQGLTESESVDRVQRYLASLAREDGGYAWDDQPRSHLTPTYAVVGSATLLSIELRDRSKLANYVRSHHPSTLKSLEQEHRLFTYQQIRTLKWLDEDASPLLDTVLGWQKPLAYLKQYEQHGYPVFIQEVSALISQHLLAVPNDQLSGEMVDYLERNRRANGSFNNTPATDGSDGNLLNTWWGLQSLAVLAREKELANQTIEWVQNCQLSNGGFTHQPHARIGAVDDVAYTWAAVRSLGLLGSQPKHRDACIDYLRSLWNGDGGFGDRPGWCSNAVATYYALDGLSALGALPTALTRTGARIVSPGQVDRKSKSLPKGLSVYTIQIQAHGQGSPRDAVTLAKSLKIHLWAAKNAKQGWIERAQSLADSQEVPVRFVRAEEEYGTWVHVDGMGTYSHTSDLVAPSGTDIGPSFAKLGVRSWEEFRQRRLKNLHAGGGRLIWQFGENEPLVRLLLDDSLERGGFSAISTFHFGNPDFTNSEPFLKRYRNQLPFVALQDAHGSEPWWFADMTEGFRTLFLADEPTWPGFLKALEENWVVAVRHDSISQNETWMHGGSDAVLDFVRQHSSHWQWWDNPAIVRPSVSMAVLDAEEIFEVGKPEAQSDSHANVRIRCAWRNTPQGLAKEPLYSLDKLTLDGEEIKTEVKFIRRPNGLYEDHYHLAVLQRVGSEGRTLQATVRRLSDQQTTVVTQVV